MAPAHLVSFQLLALSPAVLASLLGSARQPLAAPGPLLTGVRWCQWSQKPESSRNEHPPLFQLSQPGGPVADSVTGPLKSQSPWPGVRRGASLANT